MPDRHSMPARSSANAPATTASQSSPAWTVRRTRPFGVVARSIPRVATRTTRPGKPASAITRLLPPASRSRRSPAASASRTASTRSPSSVTVTSRSAGPPSPSVVSGASGASVLTPTPTSLRALRGSARLRQQLAGHAVGRAAASADQPPRELRAAEVERGVVFPGGADAAVHGDVLARGEVERAAGGHARGARRERELGGRILPRPARVVHERARVLQAAQFLHQAVLDRLVGADRAPERVALLGVGHRHLQARLHRAEGLGADQALGEVPGGAQDVLVDAERCSGGVLEPDVS